MSWITDLAGKAEDFLVKMDQNAAVAAQAVLATNKESASKSTSSSRNQSRRDSLVSASHDGPSGLQVSAAATGGSSSTGLPGGFKSSPSMSDLSKAAGKQLKLDRDAALMASLNGSDIPVPPEPSQNGDLTLQQENNLLKQEIKSLSQEIRQAMQSAKQAEKESRASQQQLKAQVASAQTAEQQLANLRKENMTLADQILDKDAELFTLRSKVEAFHVEQEHQVKLEHLQSQLDTEIRRRITAENEAKDQSSRFERERSALAAETEQFHQQLQTVKEELAATHQSFNEYKLRAQRILQDKDRLLQDIKKQQPTEEGLQPSEVLTAELNQLQQERDLLREETAQSNAQLQQCRKEITLIESRCEEEIRRLRDKCESLENRLAEERTKKELAESEFRQLNEELRYIREDLAQQRVQSATRTQQLEAELAKMRSQLTSKQNNTVTPSQAELEQRLRSLTDTLVAKQSVLEAVQSERSSLLLQLERANKMLENGPSTTSDSTDGSSRVLLNITDDELAKVTTGVSRRMRYAYSTLDAWNFRVGQALRRRPAARLALFIYMVILHFWVAFVLLTYTPEMHEPEP